MKKSKALRLAGFAGALCASGALLGTSISGTGAYFTDAHSGTINSSLGAVKVETSSTTLNFDNLLPGSYKSQTVHYTATGTGPEDIWLVLPNDGTNSALGIPDNPNALGRYGHFQVDSNAGNFVSNNLNGGNGCGYDANGHGGDANVASFVHQGDPSSAITPLPYCTPPQAILLDSNVTNGHGGDATITFGYTRVLRSPNTPTTLAQQGTFKIVATQAGVRPDDPNNPAGSS